MLIRFELFWLASLFGGIHCGLMAGPGFYKGQPHSGFPPHSSYYGPYYPGFIPYRPSLYQPLKPLPGGGMPVMINYHKRCEGDYEGVQSHPDQRQYYYVCDPNFVVFSKCNNLQTFDPNDGKCKPAYNDEHQFTCPKEGNYAIRGDCTIYYKCDRTLTPRIYSCPRGKIFSTIVKECVTGDQCIPTQIAIDATNIPDNCENKFPSCLEDGIFRSPSECSLYFECSLQENNTFLQTRFICPGDNFFDIEKKICLPQNQVACDCIQIAELVYPSPAFNGYFAPQIYPNLYPAQAQLMYPVDSELCETENMSSERPELPSALTTISDKITPITEKVTPVASISQSTQVSQWPDDTTKPQSAAYPPNDKVPQVAKNPNEGITTPPEVEEDKAPQVVKNPNEGTITPPAVKEDKAPQVFKNLNEGTTTPPAVEKDKSPQVAENPNEVTTTPPEVEEDKASLADMEPQTEKNSTSPVDIIPPTTVTTQPTTEITKSKENTIMKTETSNKPLEDREILTEDSSTPNVDVTTTSEETNALDEDTSTMPVDTTILDAQKNSTPEKKFAPEDEEVDDDEIETLSESDDIPKEDKDNENSCGEECLGRTTLEINPTQKETALKPNSLTSIKTPKTLTSTLESVTEQKLTNDAPILSSNALQPTRVTTNLLAPTAATRTISDEDYIVQSSTSTQTTATETSSFEEYYDDTIISSTMMNSTTFSATSTKFTPNSTSSQVQTTFSSDKAFTGFIENSTNPTSSTTNSSSKFLATIQPIILTEKTTALPMISTSTTSAISTIDSAKEDYEYYDDYVETNTALPISSSPISLNNTTSTIIPTTKSTTNEVPSSSKSESNTEASMAVSNIASTLAATSSTPVVTPSSTQKIVSEYEYYYDDEIIDISTPSSTISLSTLSTSSLPTPSETTSSTQPPMVPTNITNSDEEYYYDDISVEIPIPSSSTTPPPISTSTIKIQPAEPETSTAQKMIRLTTPKSTQALETTTEIEEEYYDSTTLSPPTFSSTSSPQTPTSSTTSFPSTTTIKIQTTDPAIPATEKTIALTTLKSTQAPDSFTSISSSSILETQAKETTTLTDAEYYEDTTKPVLISSPTATPATSSDSLISITRATTSLTTPETNQQPEETTVTEVEYYDDDENITEAIPNSITTPTSVTRTSLSTIPLETPPEKLILNDDEIMLAPVSSSVLTSTSPSNLESTTKVMASSTTSRITQPAETTTENGEEFYYYDDDETTITVPIRDAASSTSTTTSETQLSTTATSTILISTKEATQFSETKTKSGEEFNVDDETIAVAKSNSSTSLTTQSFTSTNSSTSLKTIQSLETTTIRAPVIFASETTNQTSETFSSTILTESDESETKVLSDMIDLDEEADSAPTSLIAQKTTTTPLLNPKTTQSQETATETEEDYYDSTTLSAPEFSSNSPPQTPAIFTRTAPSNIAIKIQPAEQGISTTQKPVQLTTPKSTEAPETATEIKEEYYDSTTLAAPIISSTSPPQTPTSFISPPTTNIKIQPEEPANLTTQKTIQLTTPKSTQAPDTTTEIEKEYNDSTTLPTFSSTSSPQTPSSSTSTSPLTTTIEIQPAEPATSINQKTIQLTTPKSTQAPETMTEIEEEYYDSTTLSPPTFSSTSSPQTPTSSTSSFPSTTSIKIQPAEIATSTTEKTFALTTLKSTQAPASFTSTSLSNTLETQAIETTTLSDAQYFEDTTMPALISSPTATPVTSSASLTSITRGTISITTPETNHIPEETTVTEFEYYDDDENLTEAIPNSITTPTSVTSTLLSTIPSEIPPEQLSLNVDKTMLAPVSSSVLTSTSPSNLESTTKVMASSTTSRITQPVETTTENGEEFYYYDDDETTIKVPIPTAASSTSTTTSETQPSTTATSTILISTKEATQFSETTTKSGEEFNVDDKTIAVAKLNSSTSSTTPQSFTSTNSPASLKSMQSLETTTIRAPGVFASETTNQTSETFSSTILTESDESETKVLSDMIDLDEEADSAPTSLIAQKTTTTPLLNPKTTQSQETATETEEDYYDSTTLSAPEFSSNSPPQTPAIFTSTAPSNIAIKIQPAEQGTSTTQKPVQLTTPKSTQAPETTTEIEEEYYDSTALSLPTFSSTSSPQAPISSTSSFPSTTSIKIQPAEPATSTTEKTFALTTLKSTQAPASFTSISLSSTLETQAIETTTLSDAEYYEDTTMPAPISSPTATPVTSSASLTSITRATIPITTPETNHKPEETTVTEVEYYDDDENITEAIPNSITTPTSVTRTSLSTIPLEIPPEKLSLNNDEIMLAPVSSSVLTSTASSNLESTTKVMASSITSRITQPAETTTENGEEFYYYDDDETTIKVPIPAAASSTSTTTSETQPITTATSTILKSTKEATQFSETTTKSGEEFNVDDKTIAVAKLNSSTSSTTPQSFTSTNSPTSLKTIQSLETTTIRAPGVFASETTNQTSETFSSTTLTESETKVLSDMNDFDENILTITDNSSSTIIWSDNNQTENTTSTHMPTNTPTPIPTPKPCSNGTTSTSKPIVAQYNAKNIEINLNNGVIQIRSNNLTEIPVNNKHLKSTNLGEFCQTTNRPRLEIKVEKDLDLVIKYCLSDCDEEHKHNFERKDQAVDMTFFENGSGKTFGIASGIEPKA